MALKSDIEIAQEARPLPITAIAEACGVDEAYLEQYGRYKAKIDNRFLKETARPDGRLVLVTAITPTPAGEGKTTTTVGLADGMRRLGKNTVVALRDKLRRGKKLEPWEREFYRAHRVEVDLHRPASPEADAEKQRLLALLNEDERRGR